MKALNSKVYFKGLDELRAIAAFAVVFHHLELFKKREGKFSLYDIPLFKPFISNLGHNGVICFFVLSGFLITYLLLIEKKTLRTIEIKQFYIRRILRIWPLYFLITFITFIILPFIGDLTFFSNQEYYTKLINDINYYALIFFCFFLSNFALVFFKPIAAASQSWSVSVEEQFYVIWPWMIKRTRNSIIFLWVVIALFIIKLFINQFTLYYYGNLSWIYKMLIYFQIEYMCIGAMGAVLLFNGFLDKAKKVMTNTFVTCFACLLLFIELFKYNHTLILALLFFYFIYVIVIKSCEISILNKLGKISYGIYMYHPIVMFFAFSFCAFNFQSILMFNIFFYLIVIIVTIIVSYFSFKYYESFFLKFKNRFSAFHSKE